MNVSFFTIRLLCFLISFLAFPLSNVFASVNYSYEIKDDVLARFDILNERDGLSNSCILDITQDQNNILWIATKSGLNKYDGNSFTVYLSNPDEPNSIPGNLVTSLDVDKQGVLWIGTDKGLCYYDGITHRFIRLELSKFNLDVYVRDILSENDSTLWIETRDGVLSAIDPRTKKVLQKYEHIKLWQEYYYYHQIFIDRKDRVWVAQRNTWPMYLDRASATVNYLNLTELYGEFRESDGACFLEDSRNTFWIGNLEGLYVFDEDKNSLKEFYDKSTYDILENSKGNLWIGTDEGLLYYDPKVDDIIRYLSDENNVFSIPDNQINKLYLDNNEVLWIGTNNGLASLNSTNEFITYLMHIPENENSPASNRVKYSITDHQGKLWVGYENHGLDRIDLANMDFKHYRKGTNNGDLASDRISCIFEDSNKDLYIGLWEGVGFARKKYQSDNFELFSFRPGNSMQDWYRDFAEDRNENFYIGFWGASGLTLFDRINGEFKESLKSKLKQEFESRLITQLLVDSKQILWIGTTESGLHKYDLEANSVDWYFDQESINTSFEKLTIHDIFQSSNGTIWIAADSLLQYVEQSDSFKVWGMEKGLPCNYVYEIQEDSERNLWLGTDKGVICFNPLWNFSISSPALNDLIMNMDFHASTKLQDGRLYFGGKNGGVLFDPTAVLNTQILPNIFLTSLSVKGEVKIPNLALKQEVELDYHENFFTIGFSNSDLTASSNYSYRYRLNGLENNWNYIENTDLIAKYTNIQPGDYELEIQLALNNSNWNDVKVKTLAISIKSPFWKQNWFIILSILIVLIVLIVIILGAYQRLLTKKNLAESKELLLRAQINPHFIFNALVAIQGYIYKKDEKSAARYLAEFSRLMRLILDNTKEEFITLEREIELMNYYLSLQKQRFKEKFEYSFDVNEDLDLMFIKIPPMLAQPFVENSVEHGVSKKESLGHIRISIDQEEDQLIYIIEDDGIGREASAKLKRNLKDHQSYGTEITEERIAFFKKQYNAQISCLIEDLYDENSNACGTKVSLRIPMNLI